MGAPQWSDVHRGHRRKEPSNLKACAQDELGLLPLSELQVNPAAGGRSHADNSLCEDVDYRVLLPAAAVAQLLGHACLCRALRRQASQGVKQLETNTVIMHPRLLRPP